MMTLKHVLETDVLVVGGGIGGLCAAISAAQGGARVTVLEKADSRRSGSGATGNDHFTCYYPKAHGNDIGVILKELLDSMLGLCHDTNLSVRFLERSIGIADKWHEWGINMKPFGDDYVFMGHAFPNRPRIFLKYDGHNQKQALTAQAKKAGAKILNHHPVLDLLRNADGITGALLDHMDDKGIDPSRHGVEFMQYEPHLIGRGLEIDINGETSIPGLYAAGDMVGNFRSDISGAAVWGWMEGEHAAANLGAGAFDEAEKSDRAKERMAWYNTFMTRPSGAHWKEAALGLQQIMGDYAAAGPYRVRSETLLDAGLKYLGDLRRDAEASVRAANAHELLRTVEAFELMDNGEAIMHAARERRESRGMHLRSDYTFTTPLQNDKFLTVRRENGRVVTEWRPRRSA